MTSPPLDRATLHTLVALAIEETGGAPFVSAGEVDVWAAEHLDGRTQEERKRAISGDFFGFLADHLRAATRRRMACLESQAPNQN